MAFPTGFTIVRIGQWRPPAPAGLRTFFIFLRLIPRSFRPS